MSTFAALTKILYDGFARLEAWQVGERRSQHLVLRSTDSVACILVDVAGDRVLLVRQCRPAMVRSDNPTGRVTELVAGRFDVRLGPVALAIKEAKEEAGVELHAADVTLLNGGHPAALSGGILTERTYIALAHVSIDRMEGSDAQRFGRADEGENIERVWMSIPEFVSEATCHDDIRVWGAAQYLRAIRAEARLKSTAP